VQGFFGDREIDLYPSGTAALSRAIAACVAGSRTRRPEVILPAYGCPDLVAACLHASAYPRLVDTAPAMWAYDSNSLSRSVSHDTVAIVAVNLLGLGDDSASLAEYCRGARISLIQDSAQFLPRAPGTWRGEYVILSFGRGKPLNLLHGGALISGRDRPGPPGKLGPQYGWRDRLRASRSAALAFNLLTHPYAYGPITALPGTGLGRVTYKGLDHAAPLPDSAWAHVGRGFELYCLRESYSRAPWQAALRDWRPCGIEPLQCPGTAPHEEGLRLALLAPDRVALDALVAGLNREGLGASPLYGTTLNRIDAIPQLVYCQGPFPNAAALADRLLTLPTHSYVTSAVVARARKVVEMLSATPPR